MSASRPPSSPSGRTLVLADGGKSNWRIVHGADATAPERHAAQELSHWLGAIGGAVLPVVSDTTPRAPQEIWVGPSNRWDRAREALNPAPGAEGFILRTGADHLLLAGEGRRGTLYAVYDFLERHLGCRWFTPGASHVPRRDRIEVGPLDERRAPAFEYREPYAFEALDPDWAARNKCNGHFSEFASHHGGGVRYALPFVHSFNELVPVEKYFDTHPEYFSEVNGVRLRKETQLCLANPDVLALCVARIREWLTARPEVSIVSVSQNDWDNPCQCAACRAVDAEEGNYSGSLIRFVNRVAAALEPDFPHVAFDTLAYQYTRRPPKCTKPRANVIVRLCTIECCFAHPLESCGEKLLLKKQRGTGATLVEDLIAWGRICQRVYVWDYVTNFANYVQPFPNLGVLAANVRLFARNGVKGVFEQGANPPGGGGEFAGLRAWVLARLLWDPAQDADALIAEYLHGVYGRGGAPLLRYVQALQAEVRDPHRHASIYDRPDSDYLTPALLAFAGRCFDEAERLETDPATLTRIRRARLPVRFAQLAALPLDAPDRARLLDEFEADAVAAGITQLSEHIPIARTMHYFRQGVHLTHFARYDGGWSPFDHPWPQGTPPPV